MGRRGYAGEFRHRVQDLVAAGRRVGDVARDLGISEQTVYSWRRQERIDQGVEAGLTSGERAELVAAQRDHPPKRRFAAVAVIAAEGLPVQLACRVLEVSESGYYARRSRAPSARFLRHVWLTEMIRQVHSASRSTYGIRRVHADLTLGHRIAVGQGDRMAVNRIVTLAM